MRAGTDRLPFLIFLYVTRHSFSYCNTGEYKVYFKIVELQLFNFLIFYIEVLIKDRF